MLVKSRAFSVMFSLLLIILGAAIILSDSGGIKESAAYRKFGGETVGTVTRAHNYSGFGNKLDSQGAELSDFTVEYTVDGVRYEKDFKKSEAVMHIGDEPTVYYHTDNPGGDIGFSSQRAGILPEVISAVIISAGMAGLIFEFRKNREADRKQ